MRKNPVLAATALAAASALALAGCSAEPAGDAESGTLTLTWQTTNQAGMEKVIDAFETAYPDAKVEAEYVDISTYFSLLRTQLAAGNASDVFYVSPGNGNPVAMEQLVPSGFLADLSDQSWTDDIYPGIKQYGEMDGKTYALQTDITAFAVLYNDQALAASGLTAPTTWSGLLEFCADAQTLGKTAYTIGAQDLFDTQSFIYSALPNTVYKNDPSFDEEMEAGDVTFSTSDGWRTTLELYTEALDAGCFNDRPTGTSYDQSMQNLATGSALGYIGSYIEVPYASTLADGVTFSLEPLPVDDSQATDDWMSVAAINAIAENADAKNPQLAKTFLEFLARPDTLAIYADAGQASIPSIADPDAEITNPSLKLIQDYAESGRTITFVDQNWPNAEVQQAMYVEVQKLLAGDGSIDAVLAAMDAAYTH